MRGTIRHLEGKYRVITFRLVRLCDGDELRFYVFLKLHAIDKNSAFPGEATITAALGWERKKIFRQVKAMEGAGRLRVDRTPGRPNVYDITWYDQENERGFAEHGTVEALGTTHKKMGITGAKPIHNQSQKQDPTSPKNGTGNQSQKWDPNNKELNNKEKTTIAAVSKFKSDRTDGRTGRTPGGWKSIGDSIKQRTP